MAARLTADQLALLQSRPSNIRNMCILAHVDHGKTTLSDCLISSNGIISSKLAGKVRYMDSTEEEQARGITMKSSAITLLHSDEPARELKAKYEAAASVARADAVLATPAAGGDGVTPAIPTRVPYLVNLIDSPGHVDFSMDVATAARLCDGALVVIDAVEGVCIQTHAVLKVAWAEGVRPLLIINKMDRLITELQLSPLDAYHHIDRILQQINVIMSEMYTAELMASLHDAPSAGSPSTAASGASSGEEHELVLAGEGAGGSGAPSGPATTYTFDAWGIDVDERVEAQLFFDPGRGNVIFASAMDGWACTLDDFAALHDKKLEVPRSLLRRAMWGEYYYQPKTKKVVTGAAAAAANKGKPLAVSLFLERLWAVYDAAVVNPDDARLTKITTLLNLDVPKKDLASKDASIRLQSVMRAWLPLHQAVLGMVVRKLPSPVEAQAKRVNKLWPLVTPSTSATTAVDGHAMPVPTPTTPAGGSSGGLPMAMDMPLSARLARVRDCIARCDTSAEAEVVVFVSKMYAVPKDSLPENSRIEGLGPVVGDAVPMPTTIAPTPPSAWWGMSGGQVGESPWGGRLDLRGISLKGTGRIHRRTGTTAPGGSGAGGGVDDGSDLSATETFVAFARVFSGVLRPDVPVFVLGPRYNPHDPAASSCDHISQVSKPCPLYMMMGRELAPMSVAYAGNVCGIGRLGGHVLKSATLCTTPACLSLAPLTFQTTPLVKVAIEPKDPRDLAALQAGLFMLNQADPCVELTLTDGGELQLSALGELHLDRCLKDLTTRFAHGIAITVSPPIMNFMETIIAAPAPLSAAATAALLAQAGEGVGGSASGPSRRRGGGGEEEEGGEEGDGGSRSEAASKGGDADVASAASADGVGVASPLASGGGGSTMKAQADVPKCIARPDAGTWFHIPSATVYSYTTDRSVLVRLHALPLPPPVTELLRRSESVLRAAARAGEGSGGGGGKDGGDQGGHSGGHVAAMAHLHDALASAMEEAGGVWKGAVGRVVSVGPRKCGPNLLIAPPPPSAAAPSPTSATSPTSAVSGCAGDGGADGAGNWACLLPSMWPMGTGGDVGEGAVVPVVSTLRNSLVQGFQLATSTGPLCAEPMWGVAFFLDEARLVGEGVGGVPGGHDGDATVPTGQLIAAMKEGCRVAFQAGTPRLVEAVYRCELQCSGGRGGGTSGEQLGKLYAVLSRRRGRVIAEDMWEGTQTFVITAYLPVVESFGFADDLRKKTSGAATSPQLVFSHWEVMEQDPFFQPTTEEEREEWGETVHEGQGKNVARVYIDAVRTRKGMPVDKKIVVHAEKQRTLARKK